MSTEWHEHHDGEWREPLFIPRWLLGAKYVGFTCLGIVSLIYGIPTLDLSTFQGYVTLWAMALLLSSLLALFGSRRKRYERAEAWGAVGITAVMCGYAFGSIALVVSAPSPGQAYGRAGFTIVLLMLTMVPLSRALYLLRRTGIRHG